MDVEVALRALLSEGWVERVAAVARANACLFEALDPSVRQRLVQALVGATRDAKWEVRKAAADALGARAAVDAATAGDGVEVALSVLEEDENRFVRQAAKRSVQRRGTAQAPEPLIGVSESEAQRAFLDRVRALGRKRLSTAQLLELVQEAGDHHYRELGADMAHELRSMIQPLRLQLDTIRERVERGKRPDPKAQRAVRSMLEGLRRVERLVADLRHYTAENDELREKVELEQVVRLGVEMGTDRAEATGVLVKASPPKLRLTDGLLVEAAPFRLALAIANLVANAYQALPDAGGSVTVRTERGAEAGEVRIVVEDAGRGMSPEELQLALQRFRTTRRAGGGTGLGLPIARRIVEVDHGGQLSIESVPGQGTTVQLELMELARPARKGTHGPAKA